MKLYEHEAKTILKKYGIPIPSGEIATTARKAEEIAAMLGKPVALKAQLLVAGRGKAGGIQFAKNPTQAKASADKLLGSRIKETQVSTLLVEEEIPIKRELYFGLTVDRLCRCLVMVASGVGGVDIEEAAEHQPKRVFKMPISPQLGFRAFHARQVAGQMGYRGNQLLELSALLEKLYKVTVDYDAELAEVNPLVETTNGGFVAADARIILDDNALFRHEEFNQKRLSNQRDLTAQEFEGLKNGFVYVKLNGNIGVVGNGAGLVMATMDMVSLFGGKPANFLDMGGGAPYERIVAALRFVFSDPQVKVLFVNILGGITLCDEVARGILSAREQLKTPKPLVVRLVGTKEEEGKHILSEAHVPVYDSMQKAAENAVELAGKEL